MTSNLVPNGVVQLHESDLAGVSTDDDSVPKGGHIEAYFKTFAKAAATMGIKDITRDLEGHLRNAGFVDIKVIVKKLPVGPWPKDPKKKVFTAQLVEFQEVCCGPS